MTRRSLLLLALPLIAILTAGCDTGPAATTGPAGGAPPPDMKVSPPSKAKRAGPSMVPSDI